MFAFLTALLLNQGIKKALSKGERAKYIWSHTMSC